MVGECSNGEAGRMPWTQWLVLSGRRGSRLDVQQRHGKDFDYQHVFEDRISRCFACLLPGRSGCNRAIASSLVVRVWQGPRQHRSSRDQEGNRGTTMKDTPWGIAQEATRITEGITLYETASHGGYHVSPVRLLQMPEHLRDKTFAGIGWFEEDCDAALVTLAFPELFTPYQRYGAVCTLYCGYSGLEWRRPAFEASDSGKALLAQVESYKKQYAHCFQMGSSGSGSTPGRSWYSAISIDGKTRLSWEEKSPCDYREIQAMSYLKSPFTREEAEARAIPGAFKACKGVPCQACGVFLFHERELNDDCAKAIPLSDGKPGPHSISISDIPKLGV